MILVMMGGKWFQGNGYKDEIHTKMIYPVRALGNFQA